MHITDPNTPAPDADGAIDPADAAAAADAGNAGGEVASGQDTPAPDRQAQALAAFERGVAEAPNDDVSAAAAPAAGQPTAGQGEGATPPAAGEQGKDKPAPAEDGAQPGAAGQDGAGKDKPDAAVEAEIKELGINNERTAKRFRELSARAAEAEPLRVKASQLDEWNATIQSTGASSEQLGRSLGYMAAINSNDPVRMGQAYDVLSEELTWLAKRLGRAAPGHDPLSEHKDLMDEVADGSLTRARAEEIARGRQTNTLATEHRNAQDAASAARNEQADAIAEIGRLGAALRVTDPNFEAKFKTFEPTIQLIQEGFPPKEWAARIKEAWHRLPAVAAPPPPPPPPAKPTPGHQPLRPTGTTPAQVRAPKTDVDAFAFGVAEAKAAGQ